MPKLLVVTDEAWVRNEVHAALTATDFELIDHADPATAADTTVAEGVDAVIVDLLVGNMGGMAVTRSVRERTATRESPGVPVVMLLDRTVDSFLAKRAGAAAWLTKPFTSRELEEKVDVALAAGTEAVVAEDGAE